MYYYSFIFLAAFICGFSSMNRDGEMQEVLTSYFLLSGSQENSLIFVRCLCAVTSLLSRSLTMDRNPWGANNHSTTQEIQCHFRTWRFMIAFTRAFKVRTWDFIHRYVSFYGAIVSPHPILRLDNDPLLDICTY